jgi:1,4-alpha-glucan branching enzyme
MTPTVSTDDLDRILRADHHDPFSVLGCHPVQVDGRDMVVVRAYLPQAARAYVVREKTPHRRLLRRVGDTPLFEARFTRLKRVFDYHIEIHSHDGYVWQFDDPYRFGPSVGDFDLQLLGEGNHLRSYDVLGAHVVEHGGVRGTRFAVWAPNARRVSVVGNFNHWNGGSHPMRTRGASGVWELFVPGLCRGELYKFELLCPDGEVVTRTDPYARHYEVRPKNAAVVWEDDGEPWGDDEWMERRARWEPASAPMSVYEVHLGSWRRDMEQGETWLGYRELAIALADYVEEQGFTHVELLPITEHPHDGSWGYQCLGYFAPTSRHGTPDDFRAFVDVLHQRGIGVILDWVPAHFPRDAHGLARFDGAPLYEHADPRRGEHPDWGTLIFDYGRREVRNFLLASALFWLEHFHLDGLRVDAVASMLYLDYSREDGEWEPNVDGGNHNLEAIDFLRGLNELCHGRCPGTLVIAEESTAFAGVSRPVYDGGLGFTFKWNMGWMHDTLDYISREPIHRSHHHQQLTFGMVYAYSENFVLPISHDEVVHLKGSMFGKMPGDDWQKLANLRAYYSFMWTMPGKKLLFMGQEFGQTTEWDEDHALPWHQLDHEPFDQLRRYHAELNRLYRAHPALWQRDTSWEGFQWLQADDAGNSVLAFARRSDTEQLVVVINFTPVVREGYVVGVPNAGAYSRVLDSDDLRWGGSGVINPETVVARPVGAQEQPASLELTLPPLGVLVLHREL